jgi:hypothetical protein
MDENPYESPHAELEPPAQKQPDVRLIWAAIGFFVGVWLFPVTITVLSDAASIAFRILWVLAGALLGSLSGWIVGSFLRRGR